MSDRKIKIRLSRVKTLQALVDTARDSSDRLDQALASKGMTRDGNSLAWPVGLQMMLSAELAHKEALAAALSGEASQDYDRVRDFAAALVNGDRTVADVLRVWGT